jgi:RNA polymerase sigma-70 factor (ECF subfamily)
MLAERLLFKRWLEQHTGSFSRLLTRLRPGGTDRDDLVQEILLQLWRSLPRLKARRRNPRGFIGLPSTPLSHGIAARTNVAPHKSACPPSRNSRNPTTSPSVNERNSLRTCAAIRRLPKVDAALVLLYLDDLSYREMADVLGISETNVGVKLNRARKTLAELMKEVPHER